MLERSEHVRLDAIDGLRAVAILAVIAYHFGFSVIASGYSGVDVFFVISGYVIARSLALHRESSVWRYLGQFYKRRMVRLFPALAFCLVAVSVLAVAFIPSSYLSQDNRPTAILAFFGLGNISLLSNLDGYFGARAEHNPFVHTWSLGVEEQFYLIFPLLFWLWIKGGSPGSRTPGKLALRSAVPLIGLVSLGIAAFETTFHQERAFYGLPSRFWELAAGVVLFQMHSAGRWIPQTRIASGIVSGIGWLLLLAGFRWIEAGSFPFPGALVPVIGTMLLISAARHTTHSAVPGIRVLQLRVATYIGRISYSLYLWHWPIVCLLKWTVGLSSLPVIGVGALLAFLFGAGSYHWIEQPFLRARVVARQPAWWVFSMGIVAAMVLSAGVNRLYAASGLPFKLTRMERERGWEPEDVPAVDSRRKEPESGDVPRLFVLGDSHAWAYTGMVSRAAAQVGMDLQMLDVAGCPVANLMEAYREAGVCSDRVGETFAQLESKARAGDVIFLASLRAYRLAEQDGELPPADLFDSNHLQARQQALDQARMLLRRLQALQLTIIIDEPKPVFRAPIFRCVDWFNRMNPVCTPGFFMSAAELKSRDAPIRNSIAVLKSEFPELIVWSPFSILCPGAQCAAEQDGKPLFLDQDHLSGNGNMVLEKPFTDLLADVLHLQAPLTGD
jgi:peptidoglycan/LPS O-acetylase OafA/YrhL